LAAAEALAALGANLAFVAKGWPLRYLSGKYANTLNKSTVDMSKVDSGHVDNGRRLSMS
jgi:hypothetical protein